MAKLPPQGTQRRLGLVAAGVGRCCAPVLIAARTRIYSSVRAETAKCNNFQECGGVSCLFCYFLNNHLLVSVFPSPTCPALPNLPAEVCSAERSGPHEAWLPAPTAAGDEGDTAGISKFLHSHAFLWLSLKKYEVQWIWIQVWTEVGLLICQCFHCFQSSPGHVLMCNFPLCSFFFGSSVDHCFCSCPGQRPTHRSMCPSWVIPGRYIF